MCRVSTDVCVLERGRERERPRELWVKPKGNFQVKKLEASSPIVSCRADVLMVEPIFQIDAD